MIDTNSHCKSNKMTGYFVLTAAMFTMQNIALTRQDVSFIFRASEGHGHQNFFGLLSKPPHSSSVAYAPAACCPNSSSQEKYFSCRLLPSMFFASHYNEPSLRADNISGKRIVCATPLNVLYCIC